MTLKKIDYMENARYWGLSAVGQELRLVNKPVSYTTNLPARQRDQIKACSVLGLTYWSDHPGKSCVWATDFHRRWHVVKIDYKNRVAEHYCGKGDALGYKHGSDKCSHTGTRKQFLACESLQIAAMELACPSVEDHDQYAELSRIWHSTPTFFDGKDWEPPPAKYTAAEKRLIKERNETKAAQRDAEIDALIEAKTAEYRSQSPEQIVRPPRKKKVVRAVLRKSSLGEVVPPRMTLEAAIAIINFDPEFLQDVPSERLVEALGATPHDEKIKAELAARGLTPAKEAS